jgi:sugar-specific transcriptional regulator TrmB
MQDTEQQIANLRRIGFLANEARVYITLAKLGPSKAGVIAKYADLDRSSMYNAVQSLLKKGLASYVTIGKIKWFSCSATSNILNLLSSKLELAREFLPELEKIRADTKPKENVRLFKGNRGVQTVFLDILDHAKDNLIFGSEGYFSTRMPAFAKRFIRQMENKGIKVRTITRQARKDNPDMRKKQERFIPTLTKSPVVTNIYADKIAIIIWSDVPEAILIENKQAADTYREYYNFMWKNARA